MATIGILTGGGDAPGLNAVIRGIVRKGAVSYGHRMVGFLNGWAGLRDRDHTELTIDNTSGILPRGGTILGSSRTNLYSEDGAVDKALETLQAARIDALIPIGGDDTLGVALKLHEEHSVNTVGVPKTIDNDIAATDYTFGFQTAVQICTDAIDRLHTTAESHHRVMIVEVMGRHAGWIAIYAGMAGGADAVLIPERPFDIDEVCEIIQRRKRRGRNFSIVVAAEGALPKGGDIASSDEVDAFGHVRLGGIGVALEKEIEKRTGFDTRATILGHVQRGGTPTAYDRVLGTRFGVEAIDAVNEGDFGKMVALRGGDIVREPLSAALQEPKQVDDAFYEVAATFFK